MGCLSVVFIPLEQKTLSTDIRTVNSMYIGPPFSTCCVPLTFSGLGMWFCVVLFMLFIRFYLFHLFLYSIEVNKEVKFTPNE